MTASVRIELWTAEEISSLLRVSKSGVYNLVREQKFPEPIRIGKCMRWDQADILAWIDMQKRGGK